MFSKCDCHSLPSLTAPLLCDHPVSRSPGIQFSTTGYKCTLGPPLQQPRLQFSALLHFLGACISGFTNFCGFVGQHDAEYSDFEGQELTFPCLREIRRSGKPGRLELKDHQSLLGPSTGRVRAAVPACPPAQLEACWGQPFLRGGEPFPSAAKWQSLAPSPGLL